MNPPELRAAQRTLRASPPPQGARPVRQSGWSSPTTPRGFPCCARFPCVHAAATTPAQRLVALLRSIHPVVSDFPTTARGSSCAFHFSRLARRSLTLRPAHSRCHRMSWHAYPKASDISSPPCLLRLLPAGAIAGWGLHPLESAAFSRRTPEAVLCDRQLCDRWVLTPANLFGHFPASGLSLTTCLPWVSSNAVV